MGPFSSSVVNRFGVEDDEHYYDAVHSATLLGFAPGGDCRFGAAVETANGGNAHHCARGSRGLGICDGGLSALLAIAVLLANTALRPLAYLLHPAISEAAPVETTYELNMVCRASDEAHIRMLLLATITQSAVGLQSIRSEDIEDTDRTTVRAGVVTSGQKNETIEQIVTRLSYEPGIAAVSWSVVPVMTE